MILVLTKYGLNIFTFFVSISIYMFQSCGIKQVLFVFNNYLLTYLLTTLYKASTTNSEIWNSLIVLFWHLLLTFRPKNCAKDDTMPSIIHLSGLLRVKYSYTNLMEHSMTWEMKRQIFLQQHLKSEMIFLNKYLEKIARKIIKTLKTNKTGLQPLSIPGKQVVEFVKER